MADGLMSKLCEILLSGEEDDCEFFDLVSISDDCEEDEASSSSFSSNSSAGSLNELSSLMEDLPIKRGLSKFFQGKSQTFTSLSEVRCIEDLAKKMCPYRKRMEYDRRNGGMYMNQKPYPNHGREP